jgi:hypothetical protein
MKPDKTAEDQDLSSVPGEFRENYRFLSELIDCRERNQEVSGALERLVDERLSRIRGKLNRRQTKILSDFLHSVNDDPADLPEAPVPPELEASIRTKKRSAWLPWEAEAIRKIDRWRGDILFIAREWSGETSAAIPFQGTSKRIRGIR